MQLAVIHSKIEFNAKARTRNLEPPPHRRPGRRITPPTRSFASSSFAPFRPPIVPLALPLLPYHSSLSLSLSLPLPYAAYLPYRSLIQSRDSGSRYISRSRRTAKFRPEVRSGFARSESGLPDTAAETFLFFFPLFSLSLTFSAANSRKTEAGCRRRAALALAPLVGRRGFINIMQIYLKHPRVTGRASARPSPPPPRDFAVAPGVTQSVVAYFQPARYARLACLPYHSPR